MFAAQASSTVTDAKILMNSSFSLLVNVKHVGGGYVLLPCLTGSRFAPLDQDVIVKYPSSSSQCLRVYQECSLKYFF